MRWTHYTESVGGGVVPGTTKHTVAFKLFGRYLIITWVWTA